MTKSKEKNKLGLSRYIPVPIRERIRKDAGFGCVLCGCVLVEYEHIEPEFNSASEHDPEKMTLLCPMCHDKVTKRIISKNRVWEGKKNPKGLEQGYVNDILYSKTDELEFLIGNLRTSKFGIAISLYGKPLFWFESSLNDDAPYTICCIFYGNNGAPIAYINRNEYIALVGNQDITSIGTTLSISDKKNGCLLEILREGGYPVHIKKLYTQLYNTKLLVKDEYSPVLFGDVNTSTDLLGGIGSLTLAGQGATSNAISLGSIPSRIFGHKLSIAINAMLFGEKIHNESGHHKGWNLKGNLVNFNYEQVGIVQENEAYSITGEFISFFENGRLTYSFDRYRNGEPIFIKNQCRTGQAVRIHQGFDLSHRLFGF